SFVGRHLTLAARAGACGRGTAVLPFLRLVVRVGALSTILALPRSLLLRGLVLVVFPRLLWFVALRLLCVASLLTLLAIFLLPIVGLLALGRAALLLLLIVLPLLLILRLLLLLPLTLVLLLFARLLRLLLLVLLLLLLLFELLAQRRDLPLHQLVVPLGVDVVGVGAERAPVGEQGLRPQVERLLGLCRLQRLALPDLR